MKTNPTCAASSAAGMRWRMTAISLPDLSPVTRNASRESLSQRTDRPHVCGIRGRSKTALFGHLTGVAGASAGLIKPPSKDACHERNHYRRHQSQHRKTYERLVRHVAVRNAENGSPRGVSCDDRKGCGACQGQL